MKAKNPTDLFSNEKYSVPGNELEYPETPKKPPKHFYSAQLVIILGIILLAGCIFAFLSVEDTRLNSGVIVAMEHLPAETKLVKNQILSGGRIAAVTKKITKRERWKITVENNGVQDDWYVKEEFYNSVSIGTTVSRK